jgi:hypothetical protein
MKSITVSFWANTEIAADNPRLIQLALRTASLSEIFALELITTTAVRCRPTALEFSGAKRANARLASAATKG